MSGLDDVWCLDLNSNAAAARCNTRSRVLVSSPLTPCTCTPSADTITWVYVQAQACARLHLLVYAPTTRASIALCALSTSIDGMEV